MRHTLGFTDCIWFESNGPRSLQLETSRDQVIDIGAGLSFERNPWQAGGLSTCASATSEASAGPETAIESSHGADVSRDGEA